jgi:hypothetical protein
MKKEMGFRQCGLSNYRERLISASSENLSRRRENLEYKIPISSLFFHILSNQMELTHEENKWVFERMGF